MARRYTWPMQKLFNKILVPMDLSARSKSVVSKVVDIAQQYGCSIHFFYSLPASQLAPSGLAGALAVPLDGYYTELESRLRDIEGNARSHAGQRLDVSSSIQFGAWELSISEMVSQEGYDLVIIPWYRRFGGRRKWVADPDRVASGTHAAVMSVPYNRRLTRLYSIVIPVTDFLPVRKLMYGIYIAAEYKTTLKLVGIRNVRTKGKVEYYLQKASSLVQDNADIDVVTDIMEADNIAQAVNQFAMKRSADLVIVNPVTQTKMPGLFSSLFGNILQKHCLPPVLTVTPA